MARKPKNSPRKTPVQARSAETVKAILEAAAHILETRGFDAYTTNAIAERAGVSVGSLYQFFPNKDAITAALIRQKAEANLEGIIALAAQFGSSPRSARIAALVRAAAAQQFDRPQLARAIDIEEARLGKDKETLASERATLEIVIDLIASPRSELPFAPDICAADLAAIVQGMTDAAGAREDRDVRALEARLLHAVTSYLRPVRASQ